jgi:hypothetical protein
VNLELYSSKTGNIEPNLVAIQATDLAMLPTILVCPLLMGEPLTAMRMTAAIGGKRYVVLCDLARPINRRALAKVGVLDAATSARIMYVFGLLLAR